MKIDRDMLLRSYREMPSAELLEILEAGGLTEEARSALLEVLDEQGVEPDAELMERSERDGESDQIDQPIASVAARFLAQIVDGVIAFNIIFWPLVLFPDHEAIGLMGVFGFIFYLLFQDGLEDGQSLGKRLFKIAVINKTTGRPCNFFSSFLRNILLLFFGYIDVLFLVSKHRQRLGDFAANTIVVRVGEEGDFHEDPF